MRLRVEDVQLVVDYLYDDEKRHFEELGKPKRHIFRTLERLRKYAESYNAVSGNRWLNNSPS